MSVLTEKIWFDLKDQLFNFILKRVNSKDISEDILQDVFLKIHLNISKLSDTDKLSSWVYQITRNSIIDYYRKKKIKTDQIPELPEDLDDDNLNAEFYGCLKSHINQLDEKDREAIVKTTFENVSQKDYAISQNLTYSAAKSRVQRARKKLNELFVECCQVETDNYGNIIGSKIEDCNC